MSAREPERHYIVEVVTVARGFPDGKGPNVSLGFSDGREGRALFSLEDPLAWAMASKVLALLDREPATPEELESFQEPGGDA